MKLAVLLPPSNCRVIVFLCSRTSVCKLHGSVKVKQKKNIFCLCDRVISVLHQLTPHRCHSTDAETLLLRIRRVFVGQSLRLSGQYEIKGIKSMEETIEMLVKLTLLATGHSEIVTCLKQDTQLPERSLLDQPHL